MNGVLKRTIADANPIAPMIVDFSINGSGKKISNLKIANPSYTADVVQQTDYYPYGMVMPNRNGSDNSYRYGFNGMEKDDEAKGAGNSYDFGARFYDSRLGRFLSLDPKMNQFPSKSPYHFSNNNPIIYNDPTGESGELTITQDANGNDIYVIKADMHFYTGDPTLKNFNHKAVIDEMMEQFNSQNLELTVDGRTLPVKIELTSDLTYNALFNKLKFDDENPSNSSSPEINTSAMQALPGFHKHDLKNNYIRLERFGDDEPSVAILGTQAAMYTMSQMGKGSTTPLHEFIHGLGVIHPVSYNDKGEIVGYDNTTDVKPGEVIPISYPTGTTYESTGATIDTKDRRPTALEVSKFMINKQDLGGGNTQTVVGNPGYSSLILYDKNGNNQVTKTKGD